MVHWVCPTCGKQWDVSIVECRDCLARSGGGEPPSRAISGFRFWIILAAGTAAALAGLALLVRHQSRPRPVAPVTPVVAKQSPSPKTLPPPEPVPEPAAPASAWRGQIEVAGIRTFYDAQNKPQVRAVLINHGEEGLRDTLLTISLRPAESAPSAPPLARFTIRITGEVKPAELREFTAPLEAFATLAAIPPWHKLRADME